MTGTQLAAAGSGKLVWGRTRNLLVPRDRGYSLVLPFGAAAADHPQSRHRPIGPIWKLNLGLWTKKVYRPLLRHLQGEGYRLGDLESPENGGTLFFFNYDWRRGNLDAAAELDRQLAEMSAARDAVADEPIELDLICQSNAAKICRYLVKHGSLALEEAEAGSSRPPRGYRVRKVILVGASNGGSLRTLDFMTRGRRYLPLVGRKIAQETFASVRPLFADLPIQRRDLFFDEQGETIEADLGDAATWRRFGWSIHEARTSRRLAGSERSDLFGSPAERRGYLDDQLARARRLTTLLARDSSSFPSVRYYLLENDSKPTASRALLANTSGGRQTYLFPHRRIRRSPLLRSLAVEPGDGHATLSSQRLLSPQEQAALAGSRRVAGGHFEVIIEREGLEALSDFLAD